MPSISYLITVVKYRYDNNDDQCHRNRYNVYYIVIINDYNDIRCMFFKEYFYD